MIVILLTNILKSNTIKASIKSVRGTAPLTTQQPIYLDKVLKADRWELNMITLLSATMGFFCILFMENIFNLRRIKNETNNN